MNRDTLRDAKLRILGVPRSVQLETMEEAVEPVFLHRENIEFNHLPATEPSAHFSSVEFVRVIVETREADLKLRDGARSVTCIRLWRVDTPEVGLHDTKVTHFGPEASEFAK